MELFKSSGVGGWRQALSSYETLIKSHQKPDLVSLDHFYRKDLPNLLHDRDPDPFITSDELSKLMQWKLTRGKWRPRLLAFVSSLSDDVVRAASRKAFHSLPEISKAVSELTVLKGVGPATASAVLAAYSPDFVPFMSDEAMEAAVGDAKVYSLKRYLQFVEKMQAKSEELSTPEEPFTPSDVERALWAATIGSKSRTLSSKTDHVNFDKKSKRKRKR